MKQHTLVLVACLVSATAVASDYYLQSGATDFSDTESYRVDGVKPANLPGADDLIYLPAGETFEVTAPSASFSALSAASRIVPTNSTLIVDVPNGSDVCELSAAFAISKKAGDYGKGTIKKRGAGTLNLSGGTGGGLGADYSYFCNLTVEEGTLRMPQVSVGTRQVGMVTVGNDAAFLLSPEASTTRIAGLSGGGLVTNATATACTLEIRCSWARRDSVNFSGKIGGRLNVMSNGVGSFLGTNSTFGGSMSLTHYVETSSGGIPFDDYVLGVANFGRAGEPSAIGTNGVVYSSYRGGRFLYLGDGETTDKKFIVRLLQIANSDAVPFEIDGGAAGGLVLEGGEFDNAYANVTTAIPRLLFSGANASPCVVAVPIKTSSMPGCPFHVKKAGSGRWEFLRAAKDSTNTGAFTIEEGELGYDSLAPAGEACAFGYATKLYKYVSVLNSALNASHRSPYAFTLGGEGTTGTLDYVGTNRVVGTGRLVGLAGTGRFTTSGSGRSEVYFNGVSAIGANAKRTLVLDGAAGTNTFANITNGAGVVSVVKRGAGTWVIEKETSFSGSLTVEGGTLVVRAPDAPYSWHRLTIKSVWANTANSFPCLMEFAMYRSDGTRCNKNLILDHSYDNAWYGFFVYPKPAIIELDAGHVSLSDGRTHRVGYMSRNINALFDDSTSFWQDLYVDRDYPVESDSSRWTTMTLRLPVGAGEVVAYDFADYDLTATLKSYMIEGSQNGLEWTTLTNATFGVWNEGTGTYDKPEIAAKQWYSTLTDFAANRVLGANEGFRVPGRPTWNGPAALANVSQVFVTSNAVLEAEGSVSIGDLEVDCASGGTVKGFALKPTGTLSLVNVPRSQSGFVLPMTFEDVSGLSNLENWTVKINGVVKAASVVVKDGVPRVYLPGVMLIVY